MASKQLGKLRQWAGEVISSREKTTVTEEFRELEKDIELRKEGAERLLLASESYHYNLSKKKDSEALDEAEKLLPIDTLGIVMIVHGEEFGEDSAFGTSLVKLGRAHCKVATLQEAYALTFQDTFLASIQKFGEDIKEYEAQRKKLESRRLSYDAAITKLEKLKNSKKEKERREAEDDAERAEQRYEETSEDVRAHMHSIQENEISQLRELTSFLDLEMNFAEQYLEVLKDVRSDWYDRSGTINIETKRPTGPTHIFSRVKDPKVGSVSSLSSKRSSRPSSRATAEYSSEDEATSRAPRSRRSSTHGRSDTNGSKPPSRSTSRASRKRSDSSGTVGGREEKEREKAEKSRRLSVAGWASNAVGSVTGRGKKNREKFASLNDDEADHFNADDDAGRRSPSKKTTSGATISRSLSRTKSKDSLSGGSPKIQARILKPPSLQERKMVRALYDFSGSSDELSFKVGDEILVINEVLDGWWMGDLDGRKGLFPTTYVEVIAAKPVLPPRVLGSRDMSRSSESFSSGNDTRKHEPVDDGYGASDIDDDRDLTRQPLTPMHSPFYSGGVDAMSITSADEEERGLIPTPRQATFDENRHNRSEPEGSYQEVPRSLNPPQQPPLMRRSTTTDIASSLSSPGKKAPPPPPPRRSMNNVLTVSPPIPARYIPTPTSSTSSNRSYDSSPFDSATELSTPSTKGCGDFKQNPFKPKGMCSNCFEYHS